MAHYPDLSVCNHVPSAGRSRAVAIGWLEPSHEFNQDKVSVEFFERLCALLINPWTFVASAGTHPCAFCRFSGGSIAAFKDYRVESHGSGLLFIPSGSKLYVSPSSIAHYVDAHGYCPPSDYQRAVMECPDMRSIEYMKALLATPAKEWLQETAEANRA